VTPETLSARVATVLREVVADLGGDPSVVPPTVVVERPPKPKGGPRPGDYATNAAMQVARRAGVQPRPLAEALANALTHVDGIDAASVAGPGFVNLVVSAAAQGRVATDIVAAGPAYGRTDTLGGQRVNVEFISANPTGPLHLGHTRWAAVGDALAAVLDAAGAAVTREFYVNDRGAQMDRFAASLVAHAHGDPVPEDGYHGEYVADVAAAIVRERPEIVDLPAEEQRAAFRAAGLEHQLAEQREQLAAFRTRFDVWTSEAALHESGKVAHALEVLRAQGHTYEADGALWMRTTDFGDDKDRVLVRQNGELTYFASDTAYYVDKRERGFDRCLYLLGADHHGYVGRLRAMAACAGDDPDAHLDVLIGQLVKILDGGVELRLSKRAGQLVTLQDVVDAAGVDAVRYSLCRSPANTPLTLDLADITRASADNPVYYVQYAHARLCSIERNAEAIGVHRVPYDPALLADPHEGDLLRALAELPRVVATAAELREPHRIARYLEDLAGTFHKFYDTCRVLPQGDEEPTGMHVARLWLVAATRVVLANGLHLLGVLAPERM
jgi:arginyl-tRNA synthetase